MNGQEKVLKTISFSNTEQQVPRDLWLLPWFEDKYPDQVADLQKEYPSDVVTVSGISYAECAHTEGDPYEVGRYKDEWGCIFENVHKGVIGEVKEPVILPEDEDWEDLSRVHIPTEMLTFDIEEVNQWCREHSDRFIKAGCCPRPFERLQFLRGTEYLYMDLITKPDNMMRFIEKMHRFYCELLEKWCQTDIGAIMFMDDWGSQRSLLINPELWREMFKPLYSDYIRIAKKYGKKTMMHSDGYILDIIPDLIEIGLDILNSQVFCMGIDNVKKFRGKITFWGELDRQHLLPEGTEEEIRNAVELLRKELFQNGGFILQMEAGPGAKVGNVMEAIKYNEELNSRENSYINKQ